MSHNTKFYLYMIIGWLLLWYAVADGPTIFGFFGGLGLYFAGSESIKDVYETNR